jgi:hypothetical protein
MQKMFLPSEPLQATHCGCATTSFRCKHTTWPIEARRRRLASGMHPGVCTIWRDAKALTPCADEGALGARKA